MFFRFNGESIKTRIEACKIASNILLILRFNGESIKTRIEAVFDEPASASLVKFQWRIH